jgi:hypothetical protein
MMRKTLNGLFLYLKKVNLVKITSKIFGNWIIIKNIIKKDGKIFIALNERKVATINCRTIQTP